MKSYTIDAEFNRPSEPDMGLLCVAIGNREGKKKVWWTQDPKQLKQLKAFLKSIEGCELIGYYIQLAEVRVIMALGLDPSKYKWRDIWLDWAWLRNKDNRYSYGPLVKKYTSGSSVYYKCWTSCPPRKTASKFASKDEKDQTQASNLAYAQAQGYSSVEEVGQGLIDCLYFFDVLKQEDINTAAKEKLYMHKNIVIGDPQWLDRNQQEIMDYCESDINDLFTLGDAIHQEMLDVLNEPTLFIDFAADYSVREFPDGVAEHISPQDISTKMGEWGMRTGVYGHRGIPLHVDRLEIMRREAQFISNEIKESWSEENELPLYEVEIKRHKKYPYIEKCITAKEALKQQWAEAQEKRLGIDWRRTDSEAYSFDKNYLDTLVRGADCPIKRYLRHKKSLTAINGFAQPEGKGIWGYIGQDSINRPNYNPYGTQTGRNGHKSSSFLFAGPHWMRAVVDPPEGKVLLEFDYGSEEVLIAALISGDKNLQETYEANDPYWHYMTLTGAAPAEIGIPTEEQRHKEPWAPYAHLRDSYKTIFLSVSYGAQAKSLYQAVTAATGDTSLTIEDGEQWLQDYKDAYSDYTEWKEILLDYYYKDKYQLMLPDFWRMGTDNKSSLSTANWPVQGTGSSILRAACRMLDEAGLEVISTMHDAVTLLCDEDKVDETIEQTQNILADAAAYILEAKGMKVGEAEVVRHGEMWIHGRGAKEKDRYLKYFE